MMKANLIKVKVYPKDLRAIPDILPFNKLLCGEPMELELDKKEILRCMNFGDVFDMTSGEEVLIDEISFKEIVEFVEDKAEEVTPDEPSNDSNSGENQTPVESPVEDNEDVEGTTESSIPTPVTK